MRFRANKGRGLLLLLPLLFSPGCTLSDSRASLLVDGPPPPPDQRVDAPTIDRAISNPDQDPPEPDQGPLFPDLGPCPSTCINGCNGGICLLDCSKGCVCPPGHSCQVDCKGDTCSGKIDCTKGKSCIINCEQRACSEAIDCGQAACTISCSQDSCGGPILCGGGGCKVTCSDHSCQNAIRCELGRCDILCSSHSCKGSVECSAACACSLTCFLDSCTKNKIKCLSGCEYSWGCTVSTKFAHCNKC